MTAPAAAQLADTMKPLIEQDIADGTVPAGIQSFADLYSHVDAGEYLVEAHEAAGIDGGWVADAELADAEARDLIDVWLTGRTAARLTAPCACRQGDEGGGN